MHWSKMLTIPTAVLIYSLNFYSIALTSTDTYFTNFKAHHLNFHLDGCDLNVSVSESHDGNALMCAFTCTGRSNCNGFSFAENVCSFCDKQNMIGFTQTSNGQELYLARRYATVTELDTFVTLVFPPDDAIGRLIFYDFKVTGVANLAVDFVTNNNDIAFHLSLRLGDIPPQTVLDVFTGSWIGPEVFVKDPFTLEVGKRSTLYILITAEKYIMWMDGEFVANYTHVLPVSDLSRVEVDTKGAARIHELST